MHKREYVLDYHNFSLKFHEPSERQAWISQTSQEMNTYFPCAEALSPKVAHHPSNKRQCRPPRANMEKTDKR